MQKYKVIHFPRTRIATFDIGRIGRQKHYVYALIELDVTDSRTAIKAFRQRTKKNLSFTAWLLKTISATLEEFYGVCAYKKGKRKAIAFEDIDISITVEREYEGQRVPLPYVVQRTNQKDMTEITEVIQKVKNQTVERDDVILGQKQNKVAMALYYFLPGFARRQVWRTILNNPTFAFKNMGNVVVTSVGMMGLVNGWFIHASVHPVSFGIGSIIKKPRVVNDEIKIREILNATILLDHDVVDGAPMARFIAKFAQNVEQGLGLF